MPSEKIKIAVLVNLDANQGTAKYNWKLINSTILDALPQGTQIITYNCPFDTKACLETLLNKSDVNCFIAAGGDGSVHWLLNDLIDLKGPDLKDVYLGAIGLGSSNDFHKPIQNKINNFPVRINVKKNQLADVGKAIFLDEMGKKKCRYFLVNASIGITANANLFFNSGDRVLRFLKPRITNLAILYAALKTIFSFKNLPIQISYNGKTENLMLSNLAILKIPYISGSFHFDQTIRPDDGWLGLNACIGMTKWELITTLLDLSKGKFSGKKKRITSYTKSITAKSDQTIALELDGEIILTKEVEFAILPKSINLLNH